MLKKRLDAIVEPVAFTGIFILTIYRIVWGGGWLILSGHTFEKVLPECLFWILVGTLFFWIAHQNKNTHEFIDAWRRNWIVLGFIILAICSIFWSENSSISLYKVFVLIFCSVIASYIGITYPNKTLLPKISYFLVLAIVLSYFLALFFPAYGTVTKPPYVGAWRGWFSPKNFMGPLMAVGTIVFAYKMIMVDEKLSTRLLSLGLLISAVGLVILSRGAAAIIILLILMAALVLAYTWVKWKNRLRLGHYIVLGMFLIAILALVLFKLNFLFGLLNKDTTLDGRLPLWSFLLNSGLTKHLLFGSGFGATWASDQFRLAVQAASGWDFATFEAHNGLLETFLSVGLVGVSLLLGILLLSLYRGIRHILKERSFLSFFPIVLILFVILANVTESYLLELESFTWFLMIYALFSTTPLPSRSQRNRFRRNNPLEYDSGNP